MPIDMERLQKLAKSIRIEMQEGEDEILLAKVNGELASLDNVLEVNTKGVDPVVNVNDAVLRQFADEINDGDKTDELMQCAVQSLYNYYVVPKVIK